MAMRDPHLLEPWQTLPYAVPAHDGQALARFAFARDREAFEAIRRGTAGIRDLLVGRALTLVQTRDLDGGAAYEDGDPIAAMIADLEGAIAEIKALDVHNHAWSDNDFCVTCGADGRA